MGMVMGTLAPCVWCAVDAPTNSMVVFFFNDTATTEIYTLSLHDALPIWNSSGFFVIRATRSASSPSVFFSTSSESQTRSEEHTSELQSQSNLVCRLLLEKKKTNYHVPSAVRIPNPVMSPREHYTLQAMTC